jgi:hypothetical protein
MRKRTAAPRLPEPKPDWERWTVDEITDGRVRLLVAAARRTRSLQRLPRGLDQRRSRGGGLDARDADWLRSTALELELPRKDVIWAEEVETFCQLTALQDFVDAQRQGKPGLPAVRPVREGDVYYVEIPSDLGSVRSISAGDVTRGVGLELLSTYEQRGVQVWDMTAAARQSSKLVYARAIRAPAPEDRPDG